MSSTKLQLRIFIEPNGKMPVRGKPGDAGIDVFVDIRGGGLMYLAPAWQWDAEKNTDVEVDVKPWRQKHDDPNSYYVCQGDSVKIPLGFRYSFYEVKEEVIFNGFIRTTKITKGISHNYWLDIRNRSGVGTKSGMATIAEVGDANYRGIIHYCAAKISRGSFQFSHGEKIAQALITPFIDPYLVDIIQVSTIEELGQSARGDKGFGDSGST